MNDGAALFRTTIAAVAPVVDQAPDPASATPCAEWTYGQLLDHLVSLDRAIAATISGSAPHRAGAQPPSGADYRAAAGRLADLLDDPTVLAGTFEVPVGALTGAQIVLLRSVEHLLHGWDLARSAGVPTTGLEPVAELVAGPAALLLGALGAQVGRRRPFADAVPVGPDADALDRLVAAFGRDPGWLPDATEGYAQLLERFADRSDVELPDGSRRGYGADGMRLNGSVFACTHRGRLMLKLPAPEVTSLIGQRLGEPLAKPGQRPMREWVLVPFDGAAADRAEQAYAFARGRSAAIT